MGLCAINSCTTRSAAPLMTSRLAQSLAELEIAAKRIDLLEVKWPQEVLDHSDLRWHKRGERHYILPIPVGERVEIFQDLLDKWEVKGRVGQNGFHQHDFPNLPEAFKF